MKQFLNDEALFKALKKGDCDAAITEFYQKVFPTLCKSSLRVVKDNYWAQEIAWDRFCYCLSIIERMNSYTELSKILFTATKNMSLTFVTKDRNWPEVYMEYVDMEAIPDGETQRDITECELMAFVWDVVGTLPEHEKKVFQLAYIERLTSEELAELLHKSVRSIESTRYRILKKLRGAARKAGLISFIIFF